MAWYSAFSKTRTVRSLPSESIRVISRLTRDGVVGSLVSMSGRISVSTLELGDGRVSGRIAGDQPRPSWIPV